MGSKSDGGECEATVGWLDSRLLVVLLGAIGARESGADKLRPAAADSHRAVQHAIFQGAINQAPFLKSLNLAQMF
jgi:hypothetical protein